MTVPEGLHSTYVEGSEEESEETEPDRPVAMTTYHTDPQLTEESKRNAQKEADSSEE